MGRTPSDDIGMGLIACSDGETSSHTTSSLWWVLTLVEATFYQPWWGSFGSRSFNLLVPGLTPPASASQLGILAPTVFKRAVESANDPKHMEDRVATPFTTLLATLVSRSLIISKLFAQLHQCDASHVSQSQTSQ